METKWEAYHRAEKNIDFIKIQQHMERVGWRYFGEPDATPSIERLRATCRHCFSSIENSPRENNRCSCGGFHVMIWTWDSGTVEVQIIFSLESAFTTLDM